MNLARTGAMAILRAGGVCLLGLASSLSGQSGTAPAALVRRAPTLNGSVDGSIQQMTAENTTCNSGASVTGDLLVPGLPTVRLNGSPNYGGTLDGTGASTPTSHTITLNSGAMLRHVIRRTDAIALPTVTAPPQPTGTRSVSLNNSSQSPGDFATLKNLTLNSNVGQIAVPPGTYGNFNANSGSGFTLGTAGATAPSVYNFQNLTLSSNSTFQVVGPVIVTLDGGFSTNTDMGNADHPEWLVLRIAGGGLSLASNKSVYAFLEAPDGTLTLNGGSRLVGTVAADRLSLNSGALLRMVTPPPSNQPPAVTLGQPATGTTFSTPASVHFVAAASDPDGAVARVEFYAGELKVGEATSTPYTCDWFNPAPGAYALTAKAYDDAGASATSAPIAITVTGSLPFLADFETAEAYTLGALNGQGGWTTTGAVTITDAAAVHGTRAVMVAGGARLNRDFPAHPSNSVVFVDGFLRAPVGASENVSLQFAAPDAAKVAFVGTGSGVVKAFDGATGNWQPASNEFSLDASSISIDWVHLTLRLDYTARRWDIYVGGVMTAADLGFSGTPGGLGSVTLAGHSSGATLFDDFYAGFENPLFADADRDGMDDAWETAHGLKPARNDRDADADHDGLSNLQEYLLGTNPSQADTDGDGLPDGWERAHGFDPKGANAANADTDADGLTDLQEYAAGTDPRKADTDNDGLPDGWEKAHGLNPLDPSDVALDSDGDGLTNLQEYQQGRDPSDYYNGVLPQLTSLVPADGSLGPGDTLSIKLTDNAGHALANAPVKFTAVVGGHLLAATANGTGASNVTVHSGTDGVATVYVKAGGN